MLAFLNAARTAEAGSDGSFLEVLHSFGFTGAIATEQRTIDSFANEFGLAFLARVPEGRQAGGRVAAWPPGRFNPTWADLWGLLPARDPRGKAKRLGQSQRGSLTACSAAS